jgi:hypothetical protein|uniref:Uncharacterized protein n=1 Tax=viral metagenome TaxID=1070528 RepID=A0A6C0HGR4_9ZZZZ
MDSTDLSDLIGNAPVQQFAPMTTGGGDPFSTPIPQQTKPAPDFTPQFNILRYSVRGLLGYISYFLAAFTISMSTPRTLLLQHIPHTYTSGGVVSYTGAAVLGLAAVVLSYIFTAVFHTIF